MKPHIKAHTLRLTGNLSVLVWRCEGLHPNEKIKSHGAATTPTRAYECWVNATPRSCKFQARPGCDYTYTAKH